MAAWSRKTLKNHIFAFLVKRPLRENFQNSAPNVFIATPIDVLCSNFVKFGGKSVKSCVAHLTKKNKISPGSPALAAARIAPKICQGQPQTMYSESFRFHPNRFTCDGVIAERVNTIKTGRRVFPIFGWSLASSRIINARGNLLSTILFQSLIIQSV